MVNPSPTLGVRLHDQFLLGGQSGAALDNSLFELLRAVRAQGSMTQVARRLGMSYRHVWGELRRGENVVALR